MSSGAVVQSCSGAARRREQLHGQRRDIVIGGKSEKLAQRTTPSGCACQASRNTSQTLQFDRRRSRRTGAWRQKVRTTDSPVQQWREGRKKRGGREEGREGEREGGSGKGQRGGGMRAKSKISGVVVNSAINTAFPTSFLTRFYNVVWGCFGLINKVFVVAKLYSFPSRF